jgi:ribonucleoside-diphosphate reductase alpha chain
MYIAEKYFNGNQLASIVWASKYAVRDKEGNQIEESPDQMHNRLSKEFARIEKKYPSSLSEQQISDYFNKFSQIIPQGSVMSVLGNPYIFGSLSNCFVIGQPEDSYGGILKKDEELVQLMKRRGGVGIDVSSLRPSGSSVNNAAQSSTGAVSFMERFSNSTREVAQGGRRGALMITIDVRHPDVKDFISIKQDLTKVTGANISVLLDNEFMNAVQSDGDYELRFPVDNPKITKTVKAKELWNTIIKCAHNTAEPGLIFKDRQNAYCPSHIYPRFKNVTTNPCSEIMMGVYDSCRLMASNIFSCVVNPFTKKSYFDYEKWYQISYDMQRLGDDLVDLELEYVQRIIKKIKSDNENKETKRTELELWENIYQTGRDGRRTGNGITALGDALAGLGIKYGSKEAIKVTDKIFRTKLQAELNGTIDLAKERGAFQDWNPELEKEESNKKDSFFYFIKNEFPNEWKRMQKYGRRNISWSTVAPTGSLSLLARLDDNHFGTSSGIEPVFELVHIRRKKINPNDKESRTDFVDHLGDKWQEFKVFHEGFKMWLELQGVEDPQKLTKSELDELIKQSPYYESTAGEIDWIKRITLQSAIQTYTTHSISSTINLPKDVPVEKVSEIYLEAWKQGLKGITVYRDQSRAGVLITESSKTPEDFEYHDSVKRPKSLEAELHTLMIKGVRYGIIVGLLDKKPYEVFILVNPQTEEKLIHGKSVKVKKGHYNFESKTCIIENVQLAAEYGEERMLTRLISGMLRHRVNPKFIYEQIDKCELPVVSVGKALSRIIKKYIPEKELLERFRCKDCGSSDIRFEEGCSKCNSCGSSKC